METFIKRRIFINKVYLRPLGIQHDCISLFQNHKIQVSLRVNQHDLFQIRVTGIARDEIVLPTVLGQKIRFSEVRITPLEALISIGWFWLFGYWLVENIFPMA